MIKHMKPDRKYIIVGLDKPYATEVYEILKRGQMAKGPEHWPEGDINFRSWMLLTFEGAPGIDYLLKDKHMLINSDELYADEITRTIKAYGHVPRKEPLAVSGKNCYSIHVKNQTGIKIEIACGEKEYVLLPDEEVDIGIMDGDCMYLDE